MKEEEGCTHPSPKNERKKKDSQKSNNESRKKKDTKDSKRAHSLNGEEPFERLTAVQENIYLNKVILDVLSQTMINKVGSNTASAESAISNTNQTWDNGEESAQNINSEDNKRKPKHTNQNKMIRTK